MQKIHYLTKNIYDVSKKLIEKKQDFIIEVDNKKDIKFLKRVLPSLMGEENIRPTILSMFLTAFKFGDISAIIGSIHQQKEYKMSHKDEDTFLLYFNVIIRSLDAR